MRSADLGPIPGISARIEATHIHIAGRMRVALQFTDGAPGIGKIYYVSLVCCFCVCLCWASASPCTHKAAQQGGKNSIAPK